MTHRSAFVRREVCPVCQTTDSISLLRCPYDRGPLLSHLRSYYPKATNLDAWLVHAEYEVVRCEGCGLVFQRNVGSEALLTELYDVWLNSAYHPDRDPHYLHQVSLPARSRDGHELMAASHALRRSLPALRVLDYGMGWGLWARVAHRLGARTFGYDLSESRCVYARKHGIEIVGLGDLPTLGLDFVNADQVLEHAASPLDMARGLASALRPGGILKISVPRAPDIERRLRVRDFDAAKSSRNSLNAIQPLEHLNCFSRRCLERLALELGLTPMRVPLASYARFLSVRGGVPPEPVKLAKALARPLYNAFSLNNLYIWLRKPGV